MIATEQQNAVRLGSREFGIPKVSIEMWDENSDKPILYLVGNGYIGDHLTTKDNLTLRLTLKAQPGMSFLGVEINETTNNVRFLEGKVGSAETETVFVRKVNIFRTRRGALAVDRHSNNIRLVAVGPDGECALYNVAIVCQRGKFFLVHQMMAHEYAYLAGDQVRIPGMGKARKWKSLGKELERIMSGPEVLPNLTLQPLANYEEPQKKSYVDGEVMFYSLRSQFGAIWTPRGEARVLWDQIQTQRKDGLAYLLEGEIVRYQKLMPPKPMPGGKNESSFQWEAFGVKVCE